MRRIPHSHSNEHTEEDEEGKKHEMKNNARRQKKMGKMERKSDRLDAEKNTEEEE